MNSTPSPLLKTLASLGIFGITFFLIMSATGAYCYYLPRLYSSTATVELAPGPFSLFNQQPLFQQIQSKQTLYPVIEDLHLAEAWKSQNAGQILSKDEIYIRLAAMLELVPQRNTNLVEIRVLSRNRVEAANIANQIAIVLHRNTVQQQQTLITQGLAPLTQELEQQRKASETARSEMEKYRTAADITDPNPNSLDPEQTTSLGTESPEKAKSKQQFLNAKSAYLRSKKLLDAAETRLASEKLQVQTQSMPIKIWEKAEPSIFPASPTKGKIASIMGGGAIAGFFFGTVVALVTAVLLSRKN